MSTELFREGGPHKIRRTGRDAYEMSISLPKDQEGRTGRECPRAGCSAGYFKVKAGTGIQNQPEAFCPYCRTAGKPSDFATKEQVRYAKDIAAAQAHEGIERMLKDSLGLDSRGKRQLVGGLINVSIEQSNPGDDFKEHDASSVPPRSRFLRRGSRAKLRHHNFSL